METLESKLNPHLFKNILNSIQSHAYQTYFALDKLANVLDYILYESRHTFVTPKDEIEFALNLIENTFKNADLQSSDAFILIVFEFSDSTLSLTVSNKISNKLRGMSILHT